MFRWVHVGQSITVALTIVQNKGKEAMHTAKMPDGRFPIFVGLKALISTSPAEIAATKMQVDGDPDKP